MLFAVFFYYILVKISLKMKKELKSRKCVISVSINFYFTVNKSLVKSRATLVVCPASLVHQWYKEVEKRCKRHLLKVLIYHGPNRENDISV